MSILRRPRVKAGLVKPGEVQYMLVINEEDTGQPLPIRTTAVPLGAAAVFSFSACDDFVHLAGAFLSAESAVFRTLKEMTEPKVA